LALLLRRQYEFPQCGINKGNIYFLFIYDTADDDNDNSTVFDNNTNWVRVYFVVCLLSQM
jgi:hypothetical protein